jgi:hypothetical protein
MHLKIEVLSLNGVFRQRVEMEFLNLEFRRAIDNLSTILGLEVHSLGLFMRFGLINLNGSV